MAEAGVRGAQRVLAQDAALRMHERERRVVADGADIAEMVGKPFKLGHECAQMQRARRNLHIPCGFNRMRKGQRISDGAVARRAAGKPARLVERCTGHELLDAFVHIPQPLFQSHHRFAVRGETEVSRLDDARVDRPNRNLVQTFPFRGQKGVCGSRRFGFGACRAGMRHPPKSEVEPGPRIRCADRLQAEQAADRAFEADRRRVQRADGRKAAGLAFQAHDQHVDLILIEHGHVHGTGIGP